MIQQISIFLENQSGRLAEITRILAEAEVDIRALSIADTTDFGILRLIVNKPDRAFEVLRDNGLTAIQTKVVAVHLEDVPGALHRVLQILQDKGINVEYAYAFITRKADDAYVIVRVEDDARAVEELRRHGVALLAPEDVYTV